MQPKLLKTFSMNKIKQNLLDNPSLTKFYKGMNTAVFFLIALRLASCSVITLSHEIFVSNEYLRLILRFLTKDLNARKVSKVFKISFDEACNFEVIDLDCRSRTLSLVPCSYPVKIPVQIPLLYLIQDFIGKGNSNLILKGKNHTPLVQIKNDFDRFADILTLLIQDQFYNPLLPESEKWSPEKLYNFYHLLQLSLPDKDFTTEILPSLNFPLNELLEYAAGGAFPDPINHDLLVEYHNFLSPNLIFLAFKSSRLDLVRILLASLRAHKVNKILDDQSRTILHYAAHFGDLDLVKTCLQLGCNINKFDFKREKPIHKAAASGHVHVVKFLYQNGAIVNSTPYNPSPIFKAVEKSHLDVANFILNETNFNSNDKSDNTSASNFRLLSMAIKRNNPEMVSVLRYSSKLSFDDNQLAKLLKLAGKVENINFRIERILESIE